MIDNMDVLFELIENSDEKDYTSLLFNIYEDKDYFTIEASFDDDNFVIGQRLGDCHICGNSVYEKIKADEGGIG